MSDKDKPKPGRLNEDLEIIDLPGGWPVRQPEPEVPKPERGEWQE